MGDQNFNIASKFFQSEVLALTCVFSNQIFQPKRFSYSFSTNKCALTFCHDAAAWNVVCVHCLLQLEALRSLQSCERGTAQCQCPLVDNFRPTMPLNDRVVTATFRKFFA